MLGPLTTQQIEDALNANILPTPDATDLEICYSALRAKQMRHTMLWQFYDGIQELAYTDSRLANVFPSMNTAWTENWCALVVDAVLDRLGIERFQSGQTSAGVDAANERLDGLWKRTLLDVSALDVHKSVLVVGEGFVVCGVDALTGEAVAFWNDARRCHMEYETDNPLRPRMAAKLFGGVREPWRLALYYPDRVEHYATASGGSGWPDKAGAFRVEMVEANPWGVLPVFHYRREWRAIGSEMETVIPLQLRVNKLTADMMVAAEFSAFPQRYIITQSIPKKNDDKLRNEPNLIWYIPAGDGMSQAAGVGQLPAANLEGYLNAADKASTAIAAISKTPKHYFQPSGDVPSGESLRALEAPLVKKVETYAKRLEPVWAACIAFLTMLDGNGAPMLAEDVDVVWSEAYTATPQADAEYVQKMAAAGVPLRTIFRTLGWTEQQLDQMELDAESEQSRQADLGSALMDNAQANFEVDNARTGLMVGGEVEGEG